MIKNCFLWGLQGLQRWKNYKGRSCRQELWSYVVFAILLGAILYPLGSLMNDSLCILMTFIMVLIMLIPAFPLWVRRLHDLNLSGKWLLLIVGIMFFCHGYSLYYFIQIWDLGAFDHVEEFSKESIIEKTADPLWFLISIIGIYLITWIVFLTLMLWRGSQQENRYGLPHDYLDCY